MKHERFRFSGSLRSRTARGTVINALFAIGLSALGLVKALVLAGLVSKADYGLWGIVFAALGTVMMLKQVGISDKYVQQDEDDQELAFQRAFTFELLLSAAFVVGLAAALPAIAALYGTPELVGAGLVVLTAFLIAPFQAPLWVFYRRMEFVRQRAIQAIDPVVSLVVSVALAVVGLGLWAFVIGFVAGVAAATMVAVLMSPYALRLRFDRQALRDYVSFSWPLFLASLAALVISQGSMLAARWDLGLEAAGVIALAAAIVVFTDRVDVIVTGTLYPAICAVRDRLDLLEESFVKSNRIALMWAVPFGTGVTLFSADLVEFGIGEKWRPAIVLLQVWGLVAAVNHVGFNWTAYYRAMGITTPVAVAAWAAAIAFLCVGVPLLLAFGLKGFAAGIAAQAAVHLIVRMRYLRELFRGVDFLVHTLRAFLPTAPAAALVLASRALVDVDRSLGLAAAELVAFVGVTAVATYLLESKLVREMGAYLRGRVPEARPA